MRHIVEIPDSTVPYETMRQKAAQWAIVFSIFCASTACLLLSIAAIIVVMRWHQ